jgi:hypothetical protein
MECSCLLCPSTCRSCHAQQQCLPQAAALLLLLLLLQQERLRQQEMQPQQLRMM